jgi:hypothetical protein
MIQNDFDKENCQPSFDFSGTFSSTTTSRFNEYRTPVKEIPFKDHTFVIPRTGGKEVNDGCCGSYSSGYESSFSVSPPSAPFKVFEDDEELSRSFDSLLLPLQSYKKCELTSFSMSPPSTVYSPFNSFQFADPSTQQPSLFSNFDVGELSDGLRPHFVPFPCLSAMMIMPFQIPYLNLPRI